MLANSLNPAFMGEGVVINDPFSGIAPTFVIQPSGMTFTSTGGSIYPTHIYLVAAATGSVQGMQYQWQTGLASGGSFVDYSGGISANFLTFNESGVSGNLNYWYRARAVNNFGTGFSNSAFVGLIQYPSYNYFDLTIKHAGPAFFDIFSVYTGNFFQGACSRRLEKSYRGNLWRDVSGSTTLGFVPANPPITFNKNLNIGNCTNPYLYYPWNFYCQDVDSRALFTSFRIPYGTGLSAGLDSSGRLNSGNYEFTFLDKNQHFSCDASYVYDPINGVTTCWGAKPFFNSSEVETFTAFPVTLTGSGIVMDLSHLVGIGISSLSSCGSTLIQHYIYAGGNCSGQSISLKNITSLEGLIASGIVENTGISASSICQTPPRFPDEDTCGSPSTPEGSICNGPFNSLHEYSGVTPLGVATSHLTGPCEVKYLGTSYSGPIFDPSNGVLGSFSSFNCDGPSWLCKTATGVVPNGGCLSPSRINYANFSGSLVIGDELSEDCSYASLGAGTGTCPPFFTSSSVFGCKLFGGFTEINKGKLLPFAGTRHYCVNIGGVPYGVLAYFYYENPPL